MVFGGILNDQVGFGYYIGPFENPSLKVLILVKGNEPHWMLTSTPPNRPKMPKGTGGGSSIGKHFWWYMEEGKSVFLDGQEIPIQENNVFMFTDGGTKLRFVKATSIEPRFEPEPCPEFDMDDSHGIAWAQELEHAMSNSEAIQKYVYG